MDGKIPGVMVSSTFYDLRQIRMDLMQFLESELGFRALISEHHSFPINPDATTIENCRHRVEHDADILVLVIGARYGSVDPRSSKSVTNLEYLSAREKGIPIYAFIEKSVLTLSSVWASNPRMDFSKQVDNPKLFEFVKQVRTEDGVWTNPFEYAQDIVKTLRPQFAYLMREGLRQRLLVKKRNLPTSLDSLSARAYQFALERPDCWEYRLFGQVLSDEVAKRRDLRRNQQNGHAFGHHEEVPDGHLWLSARLQELLKLTEPAERLINTDLKKAIGPPGISGNAEEIIFVARTLGDIFEHVLRWSLKVQGALVSERFKGIAIELAKFADDFIKKFESLGVEILGKFDIALRSPEGSPLRNVEINFSLTISNSDGFNKAIEAAKRLPPDDD